MKNKTILVCEDDEGISDIAEIVLTDNGYSVVKLHNSTNIFSTIEAENPDLVLLDLWVPGISGEEVTRTLKADPTKQHIPIIILSANKDGLAIAKNAGADDFLQKPFDIDALEKKVGQYL